MEAKYHHIFVAASDVDIRTLEVIRRAIDVAERNDADITIGHVIDSTAYETAGTFPTELPQQLRDEFVTQTNPLVKLAKERIGEDRVHVAVKFGRIRETLIDELIDDVDPDLVVCGTRGLSALKYALFGSVSTYLTRAVKCDVLVVKMRPADDDVSREASDTDDAKNESEQAS